MEALFQQFGRFHAWIYRTTGGRIGRRLAWVPCLVLITTGRTSGAVRESVLVYADDADRRVVVASNGGSDRPPGWLFNLQAQPAVEVQVATERYPATARVVAHDDADYARLWQLVNRVNGNRYDAYQSKTARPIPVVVLAR